MPKEYLDCVAALKAEGKSEDEAQKTCAIAYYKKHGKTPEEAEKMGDDKTITDFAELRDLEIVKTGDHVSEFGKKVTFTEADLDEMIKNAADLKDTVKPTLVVSHAEGDLSAAINAQVVGAPQVGWLDSASLIKKKNADGSVSLLASFKDIAKNAEEKIGRALKRISSEIYDNYKAGEKAFGKALRRIAFVGIPAIKDMQDVTQAHLVFGEKPDQPTTWVTLSEAAPKKEDDMTAEEAKKMQDEVTKLSEQVAALVKENEELKKADKPKADTSNMDVSEMAEQVIGLTERVTKMEEEAKTKDDKIKALETEHQSTVTKLSEVEQKKKREDIDRFCADLMRTGRISPALLKLGLQKFMAGLDDNEVVKFGEGPKTYDLTELQFMKKFFMSIPPNTIVRFGELAFGKADPNAEDAGKTAADRLSEATKKFMAENKVLSFNEAFSLAQIANPALAAEYQQELGQTEQ